MSEHEPPFDPPPPPDPPPATPPSPPPATPPPATPPSPPSPPVRYEASPSPAPAPRRRGVLRSFFGGVFRGVDLARRLVVNLLFLLILAVLVGIALGDTAVVVPAKAVLVVRPVGTIVEQLSGDPTERALDRLTGSVIPETLLRDVVRALESAKDDDRIAAVHLDLDRMVGGGLSTLQELRRRVLDLRAAGKPVYAEAGFFTRGRYHLASAADEVYLHPMGFVLLDGYGVYRSYFADGLDRIDVDWHVFRVGDYKSAVEPYLRNDMSEEAETSNRDWLGDLWDLYVADVAAARELEPAAVVAAMDRFREDLGAHGGDAAAVARDAGLVDHVASRDVLRERLIELVGEDEDEATFHQIAFEDYVEAVDGEPGPLAGDRVGVLVARGPIVDGSHPPGTIGGDSTAELVRQAREADRVKALVLRVDSGGGSTFASELIRRELELFRESGKPVVVSMGSVAASGGYWIATAADEIWAAPSTITGSIGIFGMFPTVDRALSEHLGVHVDGVGTNWLSGAFRLDRPLDPRLADVIQAMTEQGYEDFLTRVSQAREMSVDEVAAIAGGRVWSGVDAHRIGLVDQLGDLDGAIAAAAGRAGLAEDAYEVELLERPLDFYDRLFIEMLSRATAWWPAVRRAPAVSWADDLGRLARRHLADLARFTDPRGLYSYCFCEVD